MKKHLPSNQFLRFLLTGGLNTLFGFLVYSGFVLLNLPTWVALLAGNVVGIVFNFFTIGGMVFFDLSPSRFPQFVLSYAAVYFINLELIGVLAALVQGRVAAQAILVLPMAMLSYLILRKFVFGNAAAS